MLPVEVVYLEDDGTGFHVCLPVKPGMTIAQAIEFSGLNTLLDDTMDVSYAVFGQLKSLTDPVFSGDRIEILRPLKIDPMTNRRRRAEQL